MTDRERERERERETGREETRYEEGLCGKERPELNFKI